LYSIRVTEEEAAFVVRFIVFLIGKVNTRQKGEK
jgi:hypothetical protein